MESWKVVGGQRTTKAAGQGLRPKPSAVLLGGPNREQGERSGGEAPKNGATRHGSRGEASVQISVARVREQQSRQVLRRPLGEREIPHFVGPQHGDISPSDTETISSSEEKSGWDNIDPESYERAQRDDPVPMGCHKVVDPNGGFYQASRKCCGRRTTVRCPYCTLPLCDQHMGQCSGKKCAWLEQKAKQADGRAPPPKFNPDLNEREPVPSNKAPVLRAPAPARIGCNEDFLPGLHTVRIGEVDVPIHDGRAPKAKADENAAIKIRAVPARPAAGPAPRRVGQRPAQHSAIVPEELEMEVISDEETPVKKIEEQERMVEDMFPYLPLQPPLAIVEDIIASRPVDVDMEEVEPNWASEIARRDRQWEARFTAFEEQWNTHLRNINRDWRYQFDAVDKQWVSLGGKLQQQMHELRQTVETNVKAHFGEALQAQLEVASASHEESISALQHNLMEYVDAALI